MMCALILVDLITFTNLIDVCGLRFGIEGSVKPMYCYLNSASPKSLDLNNCDGDLLLTFFVKYTFKVKMKSSFSVDCW